MNFPDSPGSMKSRYSNLTLMVLPKAFLKTASIFCSSASLKEADRHNLTLKESGAS